MIVALDLETTGVDNKKDKIIEVALVKFDEYTFEIIDTYSTLINPGIPIPEVISNITNIFDGDLVDAPFFDDIQIQKIENFIGDAPLLGHNTNFDRDFLLQNGVEIEENLVLDTFLLANVIFPYEKSLNLGNLCESLGIDLKDAHRALDDTLGTIQLFQKIIQKFQSLSPEKKYILSSLFSRSKESVFALYGQLFGLTKTNISQQEFVKTILDTIGKYESGEKKDTIYTDIPDLRAIFSSLPNSELRENQLQMSQSVEDIFKNGKKIVIEAPTGVGKTFAYLIPSIFQSLRTTQPVIISTNTKALQDQIFYKDLTFLQQHLPYDFSFCKLKGRKNYFSISRYFEYLGIHDTFDMQETYFFSKISLWIFDTEFGELDELNFYPGEHFFLRNIHADHFLVLLESNEYKSYEHIFKARSKAGDSNIVVINHSLLLQDAGTSQPIFGQIENLIIDEAHNLEDTMTDALIKSFTLQSLKENIEKIENTLKKSNFYIDNLDNKLEHFSSHIALLFDLFLDYAIRQNTFGNEAYQALIENDFFQTNDHIKNLVQTIEISFIDILNHLQTTPDKVFVSLKTDIASLEEALSIIKICSDIEASKEYIPMFSYNKQSQNTLYYTVLNPGKYLQKLLWEKIQNIAITSATLQINESFDYIKNILHLHDFEFLKLKSDFDYARQALLYIPNDLGSIKYSNPKIQDFMLKFLEIVKGKTLVLLTSFNAIKEMYITLNLPLKKLGISILAQGVAGSKHKIANHFKRYASNSVILGTDSFWEGVDIPGDDLKYLVIHKFPFLVPTDPIFRARGKLYNDPFREYSIPKAIIKTKQGFGRLIRTKTDTGVVILLDDRYYSTNWGVVMRASFPHDINIKTGPSLSFLNLIKSKF